MSSRSFYGAPKNRKRLILKNGEIGNVHDQCPFFCIVVLKEGIKYLEMLKLTKLKLIRIKRFLTS